MAKPNPLMIDMPDVPEKWQKLLIYLQNRVPDISVLEFPDEFAARRAAKNIANVLGRGVPGCSMISTLRGNRVVIVKLHNAQKVVIREK